MTRWKSQIAIAGTAFIVSAVLTACSAPLIGGGDCSPKGGSTGTASQVVKVVSDSKAVGAYTPKSITIMTGQSIEWSWEDTGNPHSVTAEKGSFDSCLQNAGYKYLVSFPTPGTYAYKCSIHPDMKGTVNVT
jgi:plastocyanin